MKRAAAIAFFLSAAAGAEAQIEMPNGSGVSMGHLHYFVDDIAAHREFWEALGGSATSFAAGEIVAMPGVLVILSEGEFASGASVVDHVAFRVESLASIAERGLELELLEAYPGIASVYTPSGDRVELFEEGTATNVGFDSDTDDEVADRHNRPLTRPIDSHHLHFYLPEDQVLPAQDWYARHFGAVSGIRWRYDAADLPGMNLNFSSGDTGRDATRGHSLDHIGFEVEDLERYCAELAARGIVFDEPFRRVNADFAVAILTDPWGTTIELTEGLAAD